jgi:hypothetical protein
LLLEPALALRDRRYDQAPGGMTTAVQPGGPILTRRSHRPESDHERTHERSRTQVWAKLCRLGHTTCLRCEADFFTIGFMRRTLEERAAPVGREQWYGTSLSDGGGSGHDLHRMCRSARSENDREANMATCLFDREKVATHASLAPFRERSQTLAWAKPCLAVRTYNACIRSARSEKPKKRTHGRSPNWSRGPTR